MNLTVKKIGFWSGLLTTIFAVVYIVPQLIQGIDMPESKGAVTWILTPSLFLAPSFLIMMVSVYYYAEKDKKIWSQIGMLFALSYFVFVSIVYFTVLTVTMPNVLKGSGQAVALLMYVPKSFLSGIDALGYTTMSLATLFAAPVFANRGTEKWLRISFLANGVIAPVILMTQIYPLIAYLGATWIVTLPLCSILVTRLFYRNGSISKQVYVK